MTTTTRPRRIGLLTGGGDCPGLNAVIRAVTKDALFHGIEVVGFLDGYLGLIEDRSRPLTVDAVSNILTAGGTILGTSNKANPFRFIPDADGPPRDVSDRCLATCRRHGLEGLVVVGGDGTMTIAADLARLDGGNLRIIGIPKTIDNDVRGTDISFGFITAVATATEALDRVHSTAASHHRAMVVEVMGRNAGWIALHAGIASGADIILIPEIPFSIDRVIEVILERRRRGRSFSIICAAEGARPIGGSQVIARLDPTSPDPVRLGGIGKVLADEIEARTAAAGRAIEARYVVLGHVQRGGPPVPADRVLATQLGHHAMTLLKAGAHARMVGISNGSLTDVDLSVPATGQRLVPTDHPLIAAARSVYTSFGD
jgi:phosphofructokinase-like protein